MGLRGVGAKHITAQASPLGRFKLPKRKRTGESHTAFLIRWIECLPVTSGSLAGSRMRLLPFQKDIIRGVLRVGVRQAVVSMPRKGGKTALAAALCIAHLCGPQAEPNGEVYSAAADRAQAAILYRLMRAIIISVPELYERLIIRDHSKTIEDSVTGSMYTALSADANTKHGFNSSFVVYDELAQAPNRTLFDVLSTSMAARENPKMLVISTQAPGDEHVMSELVDYGQQVSDDIVEDDSFYASIHRAPITADIWSEDTWHECNPALGVFRSLAEMRAAARQARRIPARQAAFRNLYLNQRIAPDTSFLPASDWIECQSDFDALHLRGAPCVIGLDLASVGDLNAMVAYFPEGGEVLAQVWASEREMESAARAPYQQWFEMGFLQTTHGRSVDKRAIALALGDWQELYDVSAVVYDRWGMAELERLLEDEGIYPNLVPWGQGFKDMAGAVDGLERAVVERRIRHQGNPLMTWCFSNLEVDSDPAGNRKFSKKKTTGRIDPMVALAQAIGHANKQVRVEYDFSNSLVLI